MIKIHSRQHPAARNDEQQTLRTLWSLSRSSQTSGVSEEGEIARHVLFNFLIPKLRGDGMETRVVSEAKPILLTLKGHRYLVPIKQDAITLRMSYVSKISWLAVRIKQTFDFERVIVWPYVHRPERYSSQRSVVGD